MHVQDGPLQSGTFIFVLEGVKQIVLLVREPPAVLLTKNLTNAANFNALVTVCGGAQYTLLLGTTCISHLGNYMLQGTFLSA